MFGDGDQVTVTTDGRPGALPALRRASRIGEPIAWYGPIVMNTQEELRVAFEEYRSGDVH